ncbi:hypothetical protein EDD21DRAFT_311113 [Dissophora ornata]|nr:hypothetical protein EDD21DRAFT_311113 [Dissophora ornata]
MQLRSLHTCKILNAKSKNGTNTSGTQGSNTDILAKSAASATVTTSEESTKPRRRKSKQPKSVKVEENTAAAADKQTSQIIPDYKHSKNPPGQELDSLQLLVDKLHLTNSIIDKRAILAQHPEQAPLLAWIYDPLRQYHVTSSHLLKYAQLRARQRDEAGEGIREDDSISGGRKAEDCSEMSIKQQSDAQARATALGQGFDTLPMLLSALSTRAISGYTAIEAVLLFMDRFCSNDVGQKKTANGSHATAMERLFATPRSKLLLKIIDKNLKTGCSLNIIRDVYPTLIPGFYVALGHSIGGLEEARKLFEKGGDDKKTKKKSKKALKAEGDMGQKVTPPEQPAWYASRKLDGVRCLIRVDRLTGGIETISRNGKDFESLGSIQDALRRVMTQGEVQSLDGFFARVIGSGTFLGDKASKAEEVVTDTLPDQLIFDGEVCVFMTDPLPESETSTDIKKVEQKEIKYETVGGGDEGFGKEHFLKAISFAKRENMDKEETSNLVPGLEVAAYCVFDCLTDTEFTERNGTRPFSERIKGASRALTQEGDNNSATGMIRVLKQIKVESFEQLEEMVAKGVQRGWEGVMLRKDVGYEGKRSRNLLKIKQFQDAEFTVQEAMLGSMRLPLRGEFEERDNVLTNVVVLHRGNRVRVGSGFSAEDRIRFGKDPSLIIGKTITVQYFGESKSLSEAIRTSSSSTAQGSSDNEGDGAWSLRFPTVKAIYDSGPRQI